MKCSNKDAHDIIKIFHRNTARSDKERIIAEFRRPSGESRVQVLCATEALGLGVDLPDIERVIQYGIPRSLDPALFFSFFFFFFFLHRGGRASRKGKPGEAILLADEWVVGDCVRQEERSRGLEVI